MSYSRVACAFIDPSGTQPSFSFSINPSTEEPIQNSRQMAFGAPVSDLTLIPQQGVQYPLVFNWQGSLFVPAEKTALEGYYQQCNLNTVYVRDMEDNWFEVLMSDFDLTRKTGLNRRGGGIPYYWTYTMILQVLNSLSGNYDNLL